MTRPPVSLAELLDAAELGAMRVFLAVVLASTRRGATTGDGLVAELGLGPAEVAHHLAWLCDRGWLTRVRAQGVFMGGRRRYYYRVPADVLDAIRTFAADDEATA